MTLDEMVADFGPLVRLEVSESVARHTWNHHLGTSGIHPRHADALAASAKERGSDVADWRLSYHDVPLSEILAIETLRDGEWVVVGRPNPEAGEGGFEMDVDFVEQLRALKSIA